MISLNSLAQSETANWFFGFGGGIKFNQSNNTVTSVSGSQLFTNEGCATISDSSGNLLFYTDGSTIWNKNHTTMMNGLGLYGNLSSTQSAIIVPKPDDDNIYYVFTVDSHLSGNHKGLNYSEVDISLDGGLGAITKKNINLLQECSEKVAAVLSDCTSKSIWVVSFASENGGLDSYNTYHAFEVNKNGVNKNSIKSSFFLQIKENRGYLKLSPDGKKLASANVKEGLYIYDFNSATGVLNNQKKLQISITNNASYGIEFSPSSQLLYAHTYNDFFDRQNPNNNLDPSNHRSSLLQYNLLAADIESSVIILDDRQLYRGGLQLGPDGKIYRALSSTYSIGLPYLGVINAPDVIGFESYYQHNAINLSPNSSSQGLPPFISSFFNHPIDIIKDGKNSTRLSLCINDTYTLVADQIAGATYSWTVDGNALPETDFDLEVSASGHYKVYIDPNNGDCATEGEALVTVNPYPIAFNHRLIQCDEDGTKDGRTLFNLNEANTVLTGNAPDLSTKFYRDIARTDEITNPESFQNTSAPQTIYVSVINDKTTCFSFSELIINVSSTKINNFNAASVCDELNSEDGINTFNLDTITAEIQSANSITFPITYFATYNDALLEQNNLGISFTNTSSPYSQTIFARVENANNCYGISEVLLTVNKLPEIKIENTEYYCLNKFPQTITLNAGIINDSPSNYTYNWSTGETSYEIQINEVGTYTVDVTNTNNCTKQRTITIEASNIATFESINVKDVSENNTITILTSGEGDYEYRLLTENNVVYRTYQKETIFENVFPGVYKIHVRDIKKDCGTVTKSVSVIGFPKFFTPNNDGIHDTWQVYGVASMFQPDTKILIFNRFGKLIKQLNPLGNGWDGLFKGKKLPTDDYWFVVTLQDGRTFKNHFTLKY